jgi:hypothetical protein
MLAEAARVLAPGGALFVYSHVRKNAPIAKGLRAINALARGLERVGLIDMTQERLRKSDHLNPLQDVPHLETVVARAGFRIARIRYYTPIVGGFVENILVRAAEKALARRARARAEGAEEAEGAEGAEREEPLRSASPALSAVSAVSALLGVGRHDADRAAAAAVIGELHHAGDLRKQRVVLAQAHVQPRLEPAPALPHEDRSAGDDVAVVALDPEPLRVGVAPVT